MMQLLRLDRGACYQRRVPKIKKFHTLFVRISCQMHREAVPSIVQLRIAFSRHKLFSHLGMADVVVFSICVGIILVPWPHIVAWIDVPDAACNPNQA